MMDRRISITLIVFLAVSTAAIGSGKYAGSINLIAQLEREVACSGTSRINRCSVGSASALTIAFMQQLVLPVPLLPRIN
ncbi:hypothetical protein ES707_20638 [subsurface metagenome]